jgi:hypothetical protein
MSLLDQNAAMAGLHAAAGSRGGCAARDTRDTAPSSGAAAASAVPENELLRQIAKRKTKRAASTQIVRQWFDRITGESCVWCCVCLRLAGAQVLPAFKKPPAARGALACACIA